MVTLKIPYSISEESSKIIKDLRRQYSIIVRYAYNRIKEGKRQVEIRNLIKTLDDINLGSWLIQCAIMEAIGINKKNKNKTVIFGGKYNFLLRIKGKLSNEELKEKRLMPITVQGEKLHQGNRMFDFSCLDENKLIFKLYKNQHLELNIPNLRSNYKKKLNFIQNLSTTKDLTVTVKLDDKNICITYKEPSLKTINLKQNRYLGLDLNPNYIGVCIKEDETVLHTRCFDFKRLTDNIIKEKNSSESKRFKHLNNKLKHETTMVSKEIVKLAEFYKVKFVFVEDLKNLAKKELIGHDLNRLDKNLWKRTYFTSNLSKRLSLIGIKYYTINPMYTSVIGNIMHNYIDPINASLEIARRGYHIIIKKDKQFYPTFTIKESFKDQLKEYLSEEVNGWKKLFNILKNPKLRYRVPLEECKVPYKVLQMNSLKSKIKIYNFI